MRKAVSGLRAELAQRLHAQTNNAHATGRSATVDRRACNGLSLIGAAESLKALPGWCPLLQGRLKTVCSPSGSVPERLL